MDIRFDDKSALHDFGLRFSKVEIEPPEPKRMTVSVFGMDGDLDLTYALSDEIRYENRSIFFTFYMVDLEERWGYNYAKVLNYLHGKKHKVYFSDSEDWYWDCFCQVNGTETTYQLGVVTVECIAFPYKKRDIKITKTITTSGDIVIMNNRMRTIPTIKTTSAVRIEFEGKSIAIPAGVSNSTDIVFKEGKNVLTVIGSATVTFEYTEGAL